MMNQKNGFPLIPAAQVPEEKDHDRVSRIRQVESGRAAQLVSINPGYFYLCYGLSDTGGGCRAAGKDYVDKYMEAVTGTNRRLPGAAVTVSANLPARDPDGIRSKEACYPCWASNLIITALQEGEGQGEENPA